ncbi:nucleotidyltransferase substrate binding protein [Persicobacter diffluens]|uniref:Nucleotidyltransferase n=1 Tax=Persicobacter diffluens TaxID=981 RepID=A0AAN4W4A7_9BACT|nr:nucleotidyltransferase [Persicobacter diffluens]
MSANQEDIRWKQRFSNFQKALSKLREAIQYLEQKPDFDNDFESEIIKEGIIQRFEYTHELAWNVMKDYAIYQGNTTVGGSRDAIRQAFKLNLITDGKLWMETINSRNQSSHTYNESTAEAIFSQVVATYFPLFEAFESMMEAKKSEEDLPWQE